MLPRIQHLLKASPAVTALIGTGTDPVSDPVRVYRHGSAPSAVVRPYVTWSVPGGAPENGFDGAMADVFRVHVDCWADDDLGIELLAQAVRDALESAAHLTAYLADDRDPETKRFRISYAFDFILTR